VVWYEDLWVGPPPCLSRQRSGEGGEAQATDCQGKLIVENKSKKGTDEF